MTVGGIEHEGPWRTQSTTTLWFLIYNHMVKQMWSLHRRHSWKAGNPELQTIGSPEPELSFETFIKVDQLIWQKGLFFLWRYCFWGRGCPSLQGIRRHRGLQAGNSRQLGMLPGMFYLFQAMPTHWRIVCCMLLCYSWSGNTGALTYVTPTCPASTSTAEIGWYPQESEFLHMIKYDSILQYVYLDHPRSTY